MTRIAPAPTEPVEATPRRKITAAIRRTLAALYEGHCAMTGEPLVDSFHVDHIIPLELGGKDDPSNYQPLNPEAHKLKTRLDIKAIAKVRRILKWGEPKEPSRIRSRGFPKDLRKKLNGKVERRTPQ